MGLNESHIRKIKDKFIVNFHSYGINKTFRTLDEAIEYRNEMLDYVKKQDMKKIDIRNKRLLYPYNICDMLYKQLAPAERAKIDFEFVEEHAKENIDAIVERFVESEKRKEVFYEYVNGKNGAEIARERGVSRQAINNDVQGVCQLISDNINYVIYPGTFAGRSVKKADFDETTTTLFALGLGSRYIKKLAKIGIVTIKDCMDTTFFHIYGTKNIGATTAIRLYEALAKNGFFMEIGDLKNEFNNRKV